jgi:hypothetical protein
MTTVRACELAIVRTPVTRCVCLCASASAAHVLRDVPHTHGAAAAADAWRAARPATRPSAPAFARPGPAVPCYHYQPAGAEVHPNRLGTVLVNLLVGPVALDGFVRVLVTFCEFPMHWTGLVRGRNKNQDACPLLFFSPYLLAFVVCQL